MEWVIGIIGALLVAFGYVNSKRKSAESLLLNEKVREGLNKASEEEALNEGRIKSEEEKRTSIEEDAKNKQNEVITNEDILNFFNSNKPK